MYEKVEIEIQFYNALSKESNIFNSVEITEKNILLIINDLLHDMCDKGDSIKISLLTDWDMDKKGNILGDAIKYLWDGRKHWFFSKK